jgi:hypothetical protein
MVLDSQRWRSVEAVPALLFSVDGPSAVRAPDAGGRSWLTLAEGEVDPVDDEHLVLDDDVTLTFMLPPRLDLRPLRGRHVRLALSDEASATGPRAQTLSLTDPAGRPLLVARFGPAGHAHTIGRSRVRAALSQRPDGPMAFGTERLQYVVQVGQHVHVHDGCGDLVVHFVARTAFDYVAYLIVERSLWVSGRR